MGRNDWRNLTFLISSKFSPGLQIDSQIISLCIFCPWSGNIIKAWTRNIEAIFPHYLIWNISKTCRFLHHALGCVIRFNGKKHTHQLLRPRKCLSKRHRMEVMSEGGSSWIEDEEEHPVSFFVWQQQLDPEEPGLDDITTEGQSILIWNMLKLLCDQLPLILTLSYSWKFH